MRLDDIQVGMVVRFKAKLRPTVEGNEGRLVRVAGKGQTAVLCESLSDQPLLWHGTADSTWWYDIVDLEFVDDGIAALYGVDQS